MKKSPEVERQLKKKKQRKLVLSQTEMEVDRISYLPWNIVDKILSLLTLRDAVRTSILSSNWRFKWVSLTSLVFDDQSVLVSSQDPTIIKNKTVQIVDHVLLLHNGQIHRFKLSNLDVCDSDIYRWILALSRGCVKELILQIWNGQRYQLPSSLYWCDKLSHLRLSNCSLKPSSVFNGFKILTDLDLCGILMDQDLLENLICRCPLLERLKLEHIPKLDNLKIHAPKLTLFDILGLFEDVNFVNTVHLSTISIRVYRDIVNNHEPLKTTSKLVKFFASLPSIQRLKVNSSFLKCLAADMVPTKLSTSCMELSYLSLSIDFDHMDQCLAALCILRSSPNLQELEIRVEPVHLRRAVTKKLMEEDYQNIILKQLRFVEFGGFTGVPRVLDFINFLLVNSPMLERMTVGVHGCSQDMCDVELLKKLLRFKRASANAEIIYTDFNQFVF